MQKIKKIYLKKYNNTSLGTHFYLQTLTVKTGTKCLSKERSSNFDEFNV